MDTTVQIKCGAPGGRLCEYTTACVPSVVGNRRFRPVPQDAGPATTNFLISVSPKGAVIHSFKFLVF